MPRTRSPSVLLNTCDCQATIRRMTSLFVSLSEGGSKFRLSSPSYKGSTPDSSDGGESPSFHSLFDVSTGKPPFKFVVRLPFDARGFLPTCNCPDVGRHLRRWCHDRALGPPWRRLVESERAEARWFVVHHVLSSSMRGWPEQASCPPVCSLSSKVRWGRKVPLLTRSAGISDSFREAVASPALQSSRDGSNIHRTVLAYRSSEVVGISASP